MAKKPLNVAKQGCSTSTLTSAIIHIGGALIIIGALMLLVGLIVYFGMITQVVDVIVAWYLYILWIGVVLAGAGIAIFVYGKILMRRT